MKLGAAYIRHWSKPVGVPLLRGMPNASLDHIKVTPSQTNIQDQIRMKFTIHRLDYTNVPIWAILIFLRDEENSLNDFVNSKIM